MRINYEKLFSHIKPAEPPAGLFDKIILAIKREQELQKTKRLAFGFLFLLIVSLVAAPFSWTILADQMEVSGTSYFLSAAVSNLGVFFAFWQDFGLAIVESLPITGIVLFVVNVVFLLFTVRLFLHRKKLLLLYLTHNYLIL